RSSDLRVRGSENGHRSWRIPFLFFHLGSNPNPVAGAVPIREFVARLSPRSLRGVSFRLEPKLHLHATVRCPSPGSGLPSKQRRGTDPRSSREESHLR